MTNFLFVLVKKLHFVVFCILLNLSFANFAFSQGKIEQDNEGALDNEKAENIDPERNFIEGMKFYVNSDYDKAIEFFEKALKKNKNESAILHQISICWYKLENIKKALEFALRAVENDKMNPHYYVNLISVYQEMNDNEQIEKLLRDLITMFPREQNYYNELLMNYFKTSRLSDALKLLSEMEKTLGYDEQIGRRKQLLYKEMRDYPSAIKEGKKILLEYPNSEEFVIPQAELLMLTDQNTEAEALLINYIKNSDESKLNANYYLSIIYQKVGNEAKYIQALSEVFKDTDAESAQKVNILVELFDVAQRNPAKRPQVKILATFALEAHPEEPTLNGIMGDLLVWENNISLARDFYVKSLKNAPDNLPTWERLIQLDFNLEDNKSAKKHVEEALELFPNVANFWLMQATILQINKEFDESLAALTQAKNLSQNDQLLTSDIEAQFGDLYHEMRNFEKSDKAYEKSIALNPENIRSLNNYAYYLSLRKTNLAIALKMSSKLVSIVPNEATYLDTHGWVLFVNGDYKNALIFLERAASNTNSSTIIEHLGDVLAMLGKKDEAIAQWKKAKTLGAKGLIDQKITEGKFVE